MSVVDRALSAGSRAACFMHPETSGVKPPKDEDLFVFQFWPATFAVDYSPNYSEKQIPGASNPLYQWISGGGRSITFTAQFVSEVDVIAATLISGFDPTAGVALASTINQFGPSARYSVDVGAAIARLQGFMMPTYGSDNGANKGVAVAPPRMRVYFPGMGLGGGSANLPKDDVLCIMRSGPVTITACHPDGSPKIAEVSLQFSEVVQQSAGGSGSSGTAIRYIDARDFSVRGKRYRASVSSQATAQAFVAS